VDAELGEGGRGGGRYSPILTIWGWSTEQLKRVWFFELLVINIVYNLSSIISIFSKFAVTFREFTLLLNVSGHYLSSKLSPEAQIVFSDWNSVQSIVSFVINRVYKFEFFVINMVTVLGSQRNTPTQIEVENHLGLFLRFFGFLPS